MKLMMADPDLNVYRACLEFFKDLPNVEIINERFENLTDVDCMVSSANAFGMMDGGVDASITGFFGQALMQRVQERILDEYLGEQPVGTCMIVETGNERVPFIAHTPTMRVPMVIRHTDNVYNAMWAMLLAVRQHNRTDERKIETIACPGLGTKTGKVHVRQSARQMALAYKHYLNPPKRIDWDFAEGRQLAVRFGGDDGFKYPADWA